MKKNFGVIMMLFTIVLVSLSVVFVSCTENQRARGWGGKMTIQLDEGQKLVNATWKESDLWILTRPFREGEREETYKFTEKSTFGVMEGEITFVEVRPTRLGMTTPEMDISPETRARITSPPTLTQIKVK